MNERNQIFPPDSKTLTPGKGRPVWLVIGKLFDGASNRVRSDAHLVYDDRKILHVGDSGNPPPPDILGPDGHEPDGILPDYTALPGLIEAHAHLFLEGEPVDFGVRKEYLAQPADRFLRWARERLPRLARLGVAAVRDAGDRHGVGLAIVQSKDVPSGEDPVPFVESPGPAIHRKGRYGSFMSVPLEEFPDIETCVGEICRSGAGRIKLIATGIINFEKGTVTAPPQLTVEELRAFVRAALRHGRKTFAHASGEDGVERVVQAGIHSVEHGFFLNREHLFRMRDQGIAWVPTFAPVQVQVDRADELGWSGEIVTNLKRILEGHAASLRKAHHLGVNVLAGSDAGSCGVPHGFGLLREMELMEEAGMPSAEVLLSATGTSAGALELSEKVGLLAPGYRSRMILTRHCPLQTLRNLRRERWVIFDGCVFQAEENASSSGL